MKIVRVVFKDSAGWAIASVVVHTSSLVFAIQVARLKVLSESGNKLTSKIDRETEEVLVVTL